MCVWCLSGSDTYQWSEPAPYDSCAAMVVIDTTYVFKPPCVLLSPIERELYDCEPDKK